jgi:ferredoxin
MENIRFSDFSVRIIKLTFKSRFLLAKTCRKIPPLAWAVNRLLFEGDDIQVLPINGSIKHFNPKIEDIEINTNIPLSDNITLPSEVLYEMIRRSKNHFIMDFCICRVSSNCDDYPHELGCLFLGKGTKRISEKLGKTVSVDEAIEHVDKCRKAGLVHIIGRNKIDSVWLNTGPKEELLTICNCCPCCCLWKMASELPEGISKGISSMIGVEISHNKELCIGCGVCSIDTCFVNAITLNQNKIEIDIKKCRACGRCVEKCNNKALTILMRSDAVNLSIERVEKLVDVESE